ncbi:hypothetical protein V1477_005512 [Vespula maculifrons]|uniref:Uncharacterized protein n=1 Tax=Vespula maculifrons TaxID=7453 RepID=A0ABD2CPY0_VESMC
MYMLRRFFEELTFLIVQRVQEFVYQKELELKKKKEKKRKEIMSRILFVTILNSISRSKCILCATQ